MAPRKRTRQVADDDDGASSIISVKAASSSFRQDTRKRARVSIIDKANGRASTPTRESTPSSVSDAPSSPLSDAPDSPPRTQYEIMRDADFKHLDNEDLDDQQATQRVLNRPQRIGDNAAADNGIIEAVTCINFMCHERLHVELGPLINFIVGENGSGKSAVLTAITLCLGAKASSTNRGGSLKSFIKEGREHSSIRVKLKNQGDGSFQPDLFGDSIIVERHFARNGASGYKLKTELDRIISTKRRDVDEIVEHFCLQMDNPLNVLSQDNARQFLNSTSPSVKYKYFVQGVQLEALDNDYKLVEETLEAIENKLETQKGHVESLARKSEEAQRLADIVKKNEAIREKRRLYRSQMIWAQVSQHERELEKKERAVVQQTARIARAEQTVEKHSRILEAEDEKIRRVTEETAALEQEGEGLQDAAKEAEEACKESTKDLHVVHHEERTARANIDAARAEAQQLETRVKEEEDRLEAATGDVRTEKEAAFKAAKGEVKRLEKQLADLQASLPDLSNKKDDVRTEIAEIKASVRAKESELDAVKGDINQLKTQRGSPLDAYHKNTSRLLDLIARDRDFQQKPIGPIGNHVRLLKPKWSSIVEKLLGQTPNGYIVTSKQDMDRLYGLMRKADVASVPVFISTGIHLNLAGKEPSPHFDTVLRILDIDNPLVRDQLIINHAIEQTILFEERREGERVMYHGSEKPHNVRLCLCFHDTNRGEGLALNRKAHGIGTEPIPRFQGLPRLKSDADSQIAVRQETVSQIRTDLDQITAALPVAERKAKELQSEFIARKAQFESIKKEIRLAQAEVDNIEAEVDRLEGGDMQLNTYKSQLEEVRQKLEHHSSQYGEMVIRKEELNRLTEDLHKKFKEKKKAHAQHQKRVDEKKMRLNTLADSRKMALSDKNDAYEELDQAKEEKARAEQARDVQAQNVASMDEQARQHVPERVHVPEDATYEGIQKKYNSLTAQLDKVEKRLGASAEEVNDRATAAMAAYNSATRICDVLLASQADLKHALSDRISRWRYFQRFLSARTRVNFTYLLSERGFRGRMLIDHRNKALALQVEPDETRKNAKGRKTNTLSGGEKSFSSICMLLSIWEAMGSSIRCLDEFDVFMDNVNRAISTNMLITAARRSVSRQYILITPNAIEGRASLDKDVKVIRLTDPRQRTLDQMR